MVNMRRRTLLLAALPGVALTGCASAPDDTAAPAAGAPLRRFLGGFLAPQLPATPVLPGLPGQPLPPRPGNGLFVRLQMPTALALRGFDLLVADLAAGRLWRADLALQSMTGLAGAPVGPGTLLALGPDRSAWVLDPPSRQVLRFAVDGRLLQTWRSRAPVRAGLAVLDGGATVAVPDGSASQWLELRSGGALALPVQPQRPDGARVQGVDALAAGREHLFVLDQAAGVVHRVQRDGQVLDTLGQGALMQPAALAVDRFDRAWVLDASGRQLVMLAAGRPPVVRQATDLGAQLIGGAALDDRSLAVSDRVAGQVLIHPLPPMEPAR